MRPTLAAPALTALLALSACASGYGASTSGAGDNHPAVCAEQNALAKNGLTTGGQQSIACPDHGIGPRLNTANRGPLPNAPGAVAGATQTQTAVAPPSENEYNDNAALYRAGFDALVATLPRN